MSRKGITEREYWLAYAYWYGRSEGLGWDSIAEEYS